MDEMFLFYLRIIVGPCVLMAWGSVVVKALRY